MKNSSDEYILEKINDNKNRQAGFVMLLNKYKEKIYWIIRRIVIDHEDTNDVVQNTFVKVWQNLDNYRQDSKLYTWIYRIAINESITFLRSKKNQFFISIDEMHKNFGDKLEAEVYFNGSEIQRKLQKAIATLPKKQKLVFILRYFEGLSYQDIADSLDVSVGTLKASYHIAVRKIESFLKNN